MISDIKEVLEQVTGTPGLAATLSDTADILGEVGLTSLQMVDFMLYLEDRLSFEIQFEELEFDALRSIAALSDSLSRMRARTGGPSLEPA
jgi:acyl carrier protein